MIVNDTIKAKNLYVDKVTVESGSVHKGESVTARVDDIQKNIARNHTATHILHAALKEVLGDMWRRQDPASRQKVCGLTSLILNRFQRKICRRSKTEPMKLSAGSKT